MDSNTFRRSELSAVRQVREDDLAKFQDRQLELDPYLVVSLQNML